MSDAGYAPAELRDQEAGERRDDPDRQGTHRASAGAGLYDASTACGAGAAPVRNSYPVSLNSCR